MKCSEVRSFINDHPEIKCECPVCKKSPGFPDDSEISKKHFIKVRFEEINFVDKSPVQDIRKHLKIDLDYLINNEHYVYKSFDVSHLKKWISLLDSIEDKMQVTS